MNLPSVRDIGEIKGKRVLLRVDFNVPMEGGKVTDDYRIKRTLPTMNLLKEKGAKIILISHISDGRGESLRPVAEYLTTWPYDGQVEFSEKLFGAETEEKVANMKEGGILLLENLRIDEGEKANDTVFAEKLAKMGDIFVNDAFSESHREYTSIVGLPKLLPSFTGLLFEEELENLRSAFNPEHPFLLILGGIKISTKLGVLDRFLNVADKIFVGGAPANNFLKAQGTDIGKSIVDESVDVGRYLNNEKIILPVDFKIHEEMIWDCGEKTIEILAREIENAKFILWNGPLGNFEEKEFAKGTEDLAKLIAESSAKKIIGGGDTVSAVDKLGLLDKFTFVSTAGGAMLEFLVKGTLPGIEALLLKNIKQS